MVSSSLILSLFAIQAAVQLLTVQGLPGGAPATACGAYSLQPTHTGGYSNANAATIQMFDATNKAVTTYVPGSTYTITATSGANFLGYFLGASTGDLAPVTAGGAIVTCSQTTAGLGNWVTQGAVTNIATVSATWTAPVTATGSITLGASLVYTLSTATLAQMTVTQAAAVPTTTIKGQTTTTTQAAAGGGAASSVAASSSAAAGASSSSAAGGAAGTTATTAAANGGAANAAGGNSASNALNGSLMSAMSSPAVIGGVVAVVVAVVALTVVITIRRRAAAAAASSRV